MWQRSVPKGQQGLVCVRVCVSSVSLSRPPSQVINVNAFSLRLTQMGADVRSHVHTHTHTHWSKLNRPVLFQQWRVGEMREGKLWESGNSMILSLSWKTCKMTLKFMTETTPTSYHPPTVLYATRHLRWQRHDVSMPPLCLQLRLQLKDKWRSALKTTSKTYQKHSVFQPKTALRVLEIETPFYTRHRGATGPQKHRGGNLSSQFLHQHRGTSDYYHINAFIQHVFN